MTLYAIPEADLRELRSFVDECRAFRRARGFGPIGGSLNLDSAGTVAIPQGARASIATGNLPCASEWICHMRAFVQRPSTGAATGPLGVFRVSWSHDGLARETFVDALSDQFLVVFGQEVRIDCEWDLENAALIAQPPQSFPQRLTFQASVTPCCGLRSQARRTRYLPQPIEPAAAAIFDVPVPYAAKAFIMRGAAGGLAALGDVQQICTIPTPTLIDVYAAADVVAKHGLGEWMTLASLADTLRFTVAAAEVVTSILAVEFLLEP